MAKYTTIRVTKDAWRQGKKQKEAAGRTWNEQIVRGCEAGSMSSEHGGGEKYRAKHWLKKQYVEKELTARNIAERCDCHKMTIYRWLDKYDIPTRDPEEAARSGTSDDFELLKDEEWLYEQYVEKELTGKEIANKCDAHYKTVYNWLHKHDIETRGRPGESSYE
jgi:transposase